VAAMLMPQSLKATPLPQREYNEKKIIHYYFICFCNCGQVKDTKKSGKEYCLKASF
jgi:hypothetical protein